MQFINFAMLFALLAVAIPVIIQIFTRRNVRKIPPSTAAAQGNQPMISELRAVTLVPGLEPNARNAGEKISFFLFFK